MTALPARSVAALAPLRAALLDDARAQAEACLHTARTTAAALLGQARLEADALLAEAAEEGRRTALAAAALHSSRARRLARETVLARQSAIRDELRRRVVAQVLALRDDPRHDALLPRLTERCTDSLGPDAEVRLHPDGGVVARSGSRRLDLSLPTLTATALEQTEAEVSALWTA